jgi:hypothetical protein
VDLQRALVGSGFFVLGILVVWGATIGRRADSQYLRRTTEQMLRYNPVLRLRKASTSDAARGLRLGLVAIGIMGLLMIVVGLTTVIASLS